MKIESRFSGLRRTWQCGIRDKGLQNPLIQWTPSSPWSKCRTGAPPLDSDVSRSKSSTGSTAVDRTMCTSPPTTPAAPLRPVALSIVKEVAYGEHVAVVGDHPRLGSWDPLKAVELTWTPGHVWYAEIILPSGSHEFKFLRVLEDGGIEWEFGANRILQLDSDTGSSAVKLDCVWSNTELASVGTTECLLSDEDEFPGMDVPGDTSVLSYYPLAPSPRVAYGKALGNVVPSPDCIPLLASSMEATSEGSLNNTFLVLSSATNQSQGDDTLSEDSLSDTEDLQSSWVDLGLGVTQDGSDLLLGDSPPMSEMVVHPLKPLRPLKVPIEKCLDSPKTSRKALRDMQLQQSPARPVQPVSLVDSRLSVTESQLGESTDCGLLFSMDTMSDVVAEQSEEGKNNSVMGYLDADMSLAISRGTSSLSDASDAAGISIKEKAMHSKAASIHDLKLHCGQHMIAHVDKTGLGEDACFVTTSGLGAFGVADGVSSWARDGVDPGDYSRTLMSYASEMVDGAAECGQVDPVQVIKYAQYCTYKLGSATALVAVMRPDGVLSVANIGDGGLKVIRNGQVAFATEAQQHDFNLPYQLSHPKLVPDTDYAEDADVYSFLLEKGDVVVAGSDGFFDNMWEEEVTNVVDSCLASHPDLPPEEVAQKVAVELGSRAFEHAQDVGYRSPWCVACAKASGLNPVKELFMKGGKMDDCTVVVALVQ